MMWVIARNDQKPTIPSDLTTGTAVLQFFLSFRHCLLCGMLTWEMGHCISLVSSRSGRTHTEKNDIDYRGFMRVINRSSFMSLKAAFPQLLSRVPKWLMTGLFVLLVHSLSCLCSVSLPRCRSTFTIQMTLTASVLPSRKDASSQLWLSSFRYSIIKAEGRDKCNLKKTKMAR